MIAGLAFRNVLRNKERSLLTLVGVILAIGSFVALVSVAAGFTQRVERELGSREVHIYVTGSRASTLPVSPLAGAGASGVSLPHSLREHLQVNGVRSVTPVLRSSLDGPRSVIPVIAMPLDQARIVFKGGRFEPDPRDLKPKTVKLATKRPEPVETPLPETSPSPSVEPSSSPSPAMSPTPESTPPAEAEAEEPREEEPPSELEEVGASHLIYPVFTGQGLERDVNELLSNGPLVVEEIPFDRGGAMGSLGFLDYTILAPIEAFFAQRPDRGVHEFWITVEDENQVPAIKLALEQEIQAYLAARIDEGEYAGARKIKILSRREYLSSAREYLGYGWLLQVAVSMVGVLIAVTASMNTMLMSTYERLGEYATLRAVGASRRVISLTIIFEAIFLNVTGGVLGLVFGYLATGVLDKAVALILEIPYPMAGVTPALLLQALGLSFMVGIVGSLIPCFIVSRIDLVAQLRKGL